MKLKLIRFVWNFWNLHIRPVIVIFLIAMGLTQMIEMELVRENIWIFWMAIFTGIQIIFFRINQYVALANI